MTGKSRKIIASDFYTYYKPSKCPLRIYLIETGQTPTPPGPLDDLVTALGERHERVHLSTFPDVVDLMGLPFDEKLERTHVELDRGAPVIYQGALTAEISGNSGKIRLSGQPDFLIREGNGYVVRDCKLSRRINEQDHPDIIAQLHLYNFLFKVSSGRHPVRTEVFSGSGDIVEVPPQANSALLERVCELEAIKTLPAAPYTPVGWSKCSGCGFFSRCWPLAEKRRDVALVPEVTLNLTIALRDAGISTYDELLSQLSAEELGDFRVPHGKRLQRVGLRAERIMVSARSLAGKEEIVTGRFAISGSGSYAMFDLEGLPPYLDDLDRIYLWGVKVMGLDQSEFMPAIGGFGPEGDREGWERFLKVCEKVFERYGDIPFVHWSSYERTKLASYIDRYGDRDGLAERVRENLFDLLPALRNSIALPIPSYSLKVVEKYVGFHRSMDEFGGDWAIAKYIEAVETQDDELRNEIMESILRYNEEDLHATWAVLTWWKERVGCDS